MTDTPVTDPQKSDTGMPNADDAQTAIDKAELETLREKAGRIDQLDQIAQVAERKNIENYVTDLEEAIPFENEEDKKVPASPAQGNDKSDDKSDDKKSEPVVQSNADLEAKVNETRQIAMQGIIKLHQVEYDILQKALPEEERSTAKVADLQKMITGPESQLIGRLANKFNGNVFSAAAHIVAMEQGIPAARKAGADAEAAKNKAATTSNLPTGGTTAEPKGPLTEEETVAAENEKEADKIAPDSGYVYSGN